MSKLDKAKIIRVVLYLRLSDEDRNKLTKEEVSESIKNQQILLSDYAKEQSWEIVGIYNDEDWSGSDSTRPEFNKMINECKNGNVDIVLCKTQSRFARDMELVEKYIHNLFVEWNVRFITVVDRIDNFKKETKKTSQLTAMTDQWYLEDTSLNIREIFRAKRKQGLLTASFTTYGYIKDPENKNHLVIDPIASENVKRIYNEYLSGTSLEQITKNLNNDKILSPYEYKLSKGCNLKIPIIKNYLALSYIKRTGTYIINFNFRNNEEYILKDFVSFNYITTDMKKQTKKCNIILRRFSNKIKVYYSEQDKLDVNKFDEKNFKLLKENDIIPNTATVIAIYVKELDRTHIIDFQLEVTLNENRKHEEFFVHINTNKNNLKSSTFLYNIRKKFKWCPQTVKKILTDEVYIGNLVQFKTTTVSYKNHTVIHNNEEDMIRKINTHEPIIPQNIWYCVQERLENKSRSCKNGNYHAFANKVFCMNCNQTFGKCGKNNKNGFGYLCCKDKKYKWTNCNNKKYLREDELHSFVLEKINQLIKRFYDEDNLKEKYDTLIDKNLFKNKLNSLKQELQNINNELKSKETYFQKIYEDRVNGILPEKEFLILINKYKDDNTKLEERMKIIKKEISITNSKKENLKNTKNIFKKYRHIDKLSLEIVNDFIDKVLIGNYDEKSNTREIKIVWNFTI